MLPNKPDAAINRLKQDYIRIKSDPVPYITAEPLPSNLFVWHYVLKGPENSPYEGGYYHGKIKFPTQFPFEPPSICMITPNGRFETDTKLCFSMTDSHPESWNPAWTISSILTGLLSFMLETTPTGGSINFPDHVKQSLATKSLEFNIKDPTFCELFPGFVEEIKETLKSRHVSLAETEIHSDNKSNTSSPLFDEPAPNEDN